jgi:hypothetical protein
MVDDMRADAVVDVFRSWWDLTSRSVTTLTRLGTDVVRNVVTLPPPVTPHGLAAWREATATYLRELLDIPEALTDGHLPPQAVDAVNVMRTLMAPEVASDVDDGTLVRERFQRLLERSIDVQDDPGEPAFLDVVAQLTPDEARIVRYLARQAPVAVMDLFAVSLVGRGSRLVLPKQSMVAERAGCVHPEHGDAYLQNLVRLGLIAFTHDEIDDEAEYQLIEGATAYANAGRRLRQDRTVRPKGRRGSIVLTAFGHRFVAICLDDAERDGGAPAVGSLGDDHAHEE